MGCLSLEDLTGSDSSESAEPSASVDEAPGGASMPGVCPNLGWSSFRMGEREQASAWVAPILAASCGTGPYRLIGEAPRAGTSLELAISSQTGRVVEANYVTTDVGADGESWGAYIAPMEVSLLRLGAANAGGTQAFELAGTILGPFGLVPIAAAGCAGFRLSPC